MLNEESHEQITLDSLQEEIKEPTKGKKDKGKTKPREEEASAPMEEETEPIIAYGYTQRELDGEVFPGGPTRYMVEQWKEAHGNIYFTPFEGGEVYVWRTITRPRYRQIISDKALSTMDREELFCVECILWPLNMTREKLANGKAGVPSLLMEMLMDKSGFVAQSAPIKL